MRRENSTKTKWQTRSLPATFNATQTDGQRRIEGYFATFSGVYDMGDGFTEQIDPHAFDDQLGGDVRALIDHDTRLVLGRTCAGTVSYTHLTLPTNREV